MKILLRNELVTFNLNRISFLDESSFKSRESRNHQRYNYFVIVERKYNLRIIHKFLIYFRDYSKDRVGENFKTTQIRLQKQRIGIRSHFSVV